MEEREDEKKHIVRLTAQYERFYKEEEVRGRLLLFFLFGHATHLIKINFASSEASHINV